MTYHDVAFNALGDPTRRAIFERLGRGPMAVVEIAQWLPVTRPAVSQHLKVLFKAGLVTAHRSGARRLYQIDPKGVSAMRDYLDGMWDAALHAFKLAAESEGKKRK
jgi:DNA-binding transcriptional ArsR family regulator